MRHLCTLTITVLTFGLALSGCSDPSVEEQTWVLESFTGESAPVDSVPGVVSQFSLEDGTVTGNGGVNNFSGSYELSGDDISFGPLASTRMAGPPDAMEQETRFFQALESASQFEVSGDELTLLDGDDAVLMRLVAAAEG